MDVYVTFRNVEKGWCSGEKKCTWNCWGICVSEVYVAFFDNYLTPDGRICLTSKHPSTDFYLQFLHSCRKSGCQSIPWPPPKLPLYVDLFYKILGTF